MDLSMFVFGNISSVGAVIPQAVALPFTIHRAIEKS
jgi:hypothetical protein